MEGLQNDSERLQRDPLKASLPVKLKAPLPVTHSDSLAKHPPAAVETTTTGVQHSSSDEAAFSLAIDYFDTLARSDEFSIGIRMPLVVPLGEMLVSRLLARR